MRILYVEDNPFDAEFVARALHRQVPDAVLDVLPSLAAARELLAQPLRHDLALLDLNLPDGHGLELVREIRSRSLPLAVVTLTSLGDEALVMTALRAGADDYLAKTDTFAERLPATLHTALARRRDDIARHARPLAVLYVEHSALDIDLTRRHFEAHAPHLRLTCVATAEAALPHLSGASRQPAGAGHGSGPDVLMLDFRLVGDSGLELLKLVREERGLDLPVVLVTGQGSEHVAALAMRLGATDYLVKSDNYLLALPSVLENAFHRVQSAREQAALRELNASLERKVAERTAELEAAKSAAEAANRGKSDFLARLSHELRTPLNAVIGFSQLLANDPVVTASADTMQKVGHVHSAGRHLLDMIDELLDLARLEAGGLHLDLRPLDPAALLGECLALVETLAAQQAVGLHRSPGADGLFVIADPQRLRQVLVNLLSNAVKYNRPGGRVDVRLEADDETVGIAVQDTGRGLGEAQIAGLFQPFNRVGAERSGIEGTGLGLVIARQLAEAMGGGLVVHSSPGEGSTFTVRLRRHGRNDAPDR